jgi:GNAT superfamily N-acetyltransferase
MISVRRARRADVKDIAVVLQEIEAHYTGRPLDEERLPAEQHAIDRQLFGDPPAAFVLLARAGGEIAGLASYTFLWPAAGVTRSLFLKELFVREPFRHRGVGRRLMSCLTCIAQFERCSRVEWMTERANTPARRFYANLGHSIEPAKLVYRQPLK